MCQGTIQIHRKCNHVKSKTVTHRCRTSQNHPRGFCASPQSPTAYEIKRIEHPALCESCYRRHIDEIIAAHDRRIRTLREEIDRLKERRGTVDRVHEVVMGAIGADERRMREEEGRHAHEYAPLMARTWRLEDELERVRAEKKGDVADFLKTMGVLADR